MKRNNIFNDIVGLFVVLWLTMLATACSSMPTPSTQTSTATQLVPTPTLSGIDEAVDEPDKPKIQSLTVEELAALAAQRTPVPSPTPDVFDRAVEQVAAETGIIGKRFLGLRAEDWINLGLSFLIVLVGSLLIIPLLYRFLKWAVRQTSTKFDDEFLATIGRELRWLVVILLSGRAVLRLDFLSDVVRGLLDDIFFLLSLGVIYIISMRLVSFTGDQYLKRLKPDVDQERWVSIMTTLKRSGYLLVTLVALSIASSHFGVNITLPSVILIFAAVVIALAARTTIDDAISGFVILVVQQFRIGDTIFIKELDTTGDVVEIGLLTTNLYARDNRLVIIPNSQIAQSQVINYSYPDPSFRVYTEIGVAYDADISLMRKVIVETVQEVDGVLPDKPVEVLYLAFGDSTRQIRVRWWVETVKDRRRVLDRVHEALEIALAQAGIDVPNPAYDLYVNMESE